MEELSAVRRYETSLAVLEKFCKENTELQVIVHDADYPFRVEFLPDPQLTMFTEENIDDSGEVRTMVISVGLKTEVKSKLTFALPAPELKKLIRLTESTGAHYYQAFHQKVTAKLKGEEA